MPLFRSLATSLRSGYRRMFQHEEDLRTREIIGVMKQVPVFRGFSRGTLRELAEVVHTRTYRRDEFLYYEGDPGLGLYAVRHGRVRLLMQDEGGNVHELRQVGENEIFGDLSLLGDFRRMESAQAMTETQVLGFFRPDLNIILRRNPQAGAAITMALAQYLAARQVELVRLLSVRESKEAAAHLLHGAAVRADIYDVAEQVAR